MKHLYFVRHGQSEMNVAKIFSGRTDTPLTKKGVEQALAAGKLAHQQKLKFDLILSSPLKRAEKTAECIAESVNYPLEKIQFIDNLMERAFGELEGKNYHETFGVSIEKYANEPKSVDHISGIEKLVELHGRAEKVLEYLLNIPEDTILVVGHGAFLRSLKKVIEKIPFDEPISPIDNAKIIKLI